MPGLLAEGVGDVGETDVGVPFQAGVVAAVVGPLAHGFGVRTVALPLQVHATPGAVGVAGDQVMLVLIRPLRGVFVAGSAQIAVFVIVVVRQLAQGRAFVHQPQGVDAAVVVELGVDVLMRGVALVGDQVR